MRQTVKDSLVNYVAAPETKGGKPTIKKGVIIEVINQGAARIDFTPRTKEGGAADEEKAPLGTHTAIASYSEHGEIGTFHYPDEAKAVKAAESFGESPQPEPAPSKAAAPAAARP